MKRVVLVICFLLAFQSINSHLIVDRMIHDIYKSQVKDVTDDKTKCELCLNIVDNVIQNVLNIFLSEFRIIGVISGRNCATIFNIYIIECSGNLYEPKTEP